jgi:hypothetical protein
MAMLTTHRIAFCLSLAIVLVVAGCSQTPATSSEVIPFAPREDTTIKDPENPTKVFRLDMARVEREYPLSRTDLQKIMPEMLSTLTQEEIDQIYGRLTAGPIPDGIYMGDLFFARGDNTRKRLDEILGGIEGRVAGAKLDVLEDIGRVLWKGKVFYRDQRVLRNMIADAAVLRPLIGDPSTLMREVIPRRGWLSAVLPRDEVWLLFPAKLYCGQSLLDGRRESVIIDYLYSDEIIGYRPSPDSLGGRGGMRIRDEIRMVRPGLYLGRAYANKMFLLNFVLWNPDVADRDNAAFNAGAAIAEDCWPGEQARAAAR